MADKVSPVSAVPSLGSGVTALAAGGYHTCALTTAGAVQCWGRNGFGQLGDGSTTDRTGVVRAAPGGGGVLRGRSVTTDGQGHGSVRSGAVVVGPNGATAVRQGQSARNADGSASHSSAMAAQGDRGTLQSTGAATRSADGSVTQGRTTTATSATTGNSVKTSSFRAY